MNKLLTGLCLASFLFLNVQAQTIGSSDQVKKAGLPSIHKTYTEKFSKINNIRNGIVPTFEIGGVAFPDPERNFIFSENIMYAGDLNLDGKSDFYFKTRTADETTSNLSDYVYKVVILYGSENGLSTQNEKILRGDFDFITDLSGEGLPEIIKNDEGIYKLAIINSIEEINIYDELDFIKIPKLFNSFSFGDFNNDGKSDFLSYDGNYILPSQTRDFYLIYGGDSEEDIVIDTLTFENNFMLNGEGLRRYDKILYNDVDADGITEVINVSYYSEDIGMITISKMDDYELNVVSIDTLNIGVFGSFNRFIIGEIATVDVNGDGKSELIVSSDNRLKIFTLSDNEEKYYSQNTLLINDFVARDFAIINDFNNDDVQELVLINSDGAVSFLTSDAEFNFTITDLPKQEGDIFGLPENQSEYRQSGGDVDGDGVTDILVEFQNQDTNRKGYRVYFGNNEAILTDSVSTTITESAQISSPIYAFNIGDFNNDGVEDFGVVRSPENEVEIYFGGLLNNEKSPDLIIKENVSTIFSPDKGDFNGDGVSDILIPSATYLENSSASRIRIFHGSSNPDTLADHVMNFSEVLPGAFETRGFGTVRSIGDINNDGADDIIYFSDDANSHIGKAHISLGGETISSSPDISFRPKNGLPSNFAPAGDFNNDGISDFAVTVPSRPDYINIYNGFDSDNGEIFNVEPMVIIQGPEYDGETVFIYLQYFGHTFANGDFDGDGISDLAITSLFHDDGETGQGAEAIRIYKGGTTPDSFVDGKIYLESEYFSGELTFDTKDPKSKNLGSIATVPDLNNDGKDELLFANGGYGTNAAVFFGGNLDTMGTNVGIFLRSPNQTKGLSPYVAFTDRGRGVPAVGDFDGNQETEFILPQTDDRNFLKAPVYVYNANSMPVSIEENSGNTLQFELSQNYPNPFNPVTQITYSLAKTEKVSLKVYDITGRLVSTLVNELKTAGSYTQSFDASGLSSGIYFYRLSSSEGIQTRKMTLIK